MVPKKEKEFIELFYSNMSLKDMENTYGVDQRKIRGIWRQKFGNEMVKNRGKSITSNKVKNSKELNNDIINNIYFLSEKHSTKEVAKKLNISKSVVNKYLSKNKKVLYKIKERNIENSRVRMKELRKNSVKQPKTLSEGKIESIIKEFSSNLLLIDISRKK